MPISLTPEPRQETTQLDVEIPGVSYQGVCGTDLLGSADEAVQVAGRVELATNLSSERSLARSEESSVTIGPRLRESSVFPLSSAQERLWLLEQWQPANVARQHVEAFRFRGQLDRQALDRALDELTDRHETWRTTFSDEEGEPRQRVAVTRRTTITSREDKHLTVDAVIAAELNRSFDLRHGPLVRATLLRLDAQDHVLLLTLHRLVSDRCSGTVLLQELGTLYSAFASGAPSPLAPLPIQYGDYAEWERAPEQQQIVEHQLRYWTEQLHRAPALLELPTDRSRPPVASGRGARHELRLVKECRTKLDALSRAEGATVFMGVLAGFAALLARYAGQTDIVLGLESAGRYQRGTEGLLGCFANPLVLRTDVSGDTSFRTVLRQVRDGVRQGEMHRAVPFARIVDALQAPRNLSHHPVFQVLVVQRHAPERAWAQDGFTVSRLSVECGTAPYDLTLEVIDADDELVCVFEYATDLFDESTVRRLGGHLETLLAGVSTHPEQNVSALPLLTPAEREQLEQWNATAASYPRESTLVDLFDAQVARTPDAPAVSLAEATLTYRQLNARANQLAHYLVRCGVGPDVLVGLCVERSLEMVVGLLGILKAGGAYVPLDPTYPTERVAFMLEDASPSVLVTVQRLLGTLPPHAAADVCLDTDWNAIGQESQHAPMSSATADSLAYVLYTSGSTGKPKGVLGVHRAAVNRFAWMWDTYPFEEGEICCQKTTLNFVDSVWEIFGPLLRGVPTIVVPDDAAKDPHRLVDCLAAANVSRIVLVPSLLRLLLESHADLADRLPRLRHWICSGEALPLDLCRRFDRRMPEAVLLNLYGSSEVAADVSCFDTRLLTRDMESVPIGQPIANTQLYVLDPARQLLPIGIPGELYVGGDGLARGYLHRPALTRERFVPDPFGPSPEGRLYRTGDQVRWRPDGTIEYLGRLDQQVKLRGIRIELGEIEAALERQPGVREAVVVLQTEGDDPRLVAYLVGEAPMVSGAPELRRQLKEILPDYMMPALFMVLDRLPLTPNGKVDRRALPAPEPRHPEADQAQAAPRGPIEENLAKIWRELLRLDHVGVHDNFFDLGGHSLLAVRLFSRIEKTFGKRLPLATLVDAATIAKLARRVGPEQGRPSWSSLVPIQREGSRIPFFCTHGAGANVLHLRTLSQHLGSDQPFYGLQAQGLDGETPPYQRVEDMAAHYIREIRREQPEGPYVLGGFSLGGVVAFEMAQQLRSDGEEVAALLLIDTYFPGTPTYVPARTRFQASVYPFVARVESYVGAWSRVGTVRFLRDWVALVSAYLQRRIGRVAKRLSSRVTLEGWDAPESLKQVIAANVQAERDYVPGKYPGPVVLFWSSEPSIGDWDTRLAWEEAAGDGLEVLVVPGNHTTLREEPHVMVLAAKLKSYLDRRLYSESGRVISQSRQSSGFSHSQSSRQSPDRSHHSRPS